jgi:para-nitrobenzyl esterase
MPRLPGCRGSLAMALAMSSWSVAIAAPTAVTDTGTFSAVRSPTSSDVDVFYGIRYAAAPEGSLRWQPPQPPPVPSEVVHASAPGAACPQSYSTAPLAQSEDCLFLNVWVPAKTLPGSKLPVFFWIHGGALIFGTGASYDPSVMVEQNNIIVVTINYRLGALGWLVEPGLLAIQASFFQNLGDAGDYGLMDQQFALQWVQRNIGGFGGDPTRVTMGGESAGGLSTSSNMVSTVTAQGLFRGAIIESGAYDLRSVPQAAVYEDEFGANFDSALGCSQPDDAACLRAASVSNILAAQSSVFGADGISPDFGTKVLPIGLSDAFATGAFIHVPVLQGTNANEGRLFEPLVIPLASSLATIQAAGGPANYDLSHANGFCASPQNTGTPAVCTYPQEINLFFAAFAIPAEINSSVFDALVAQEYPLTNFPDPFLANDAPSSDEALSQIFTDLVFACNGVDSNQDLSAFVPVYGYEFNDPNAPPTPGFGTAVKPPNDVYGFPTASEHASELQFLFNFETPLNKDELKLAGEMKIYWGNFVNSLNPNTPTIPASAWTSFNSTGAIQNLLPGPALPASLFTFRQEHFCATWEPIISAETGLLP